MGFMDKAKQMAEQAQQKIEDAQKQFNESQAQKAGGTPSAEGVRYDEHGRPVQQAPPASEVPASPVEPAAPAASDGEIDPATAQGVAVPQPPEATGGDPAAAGEQAEEQEMPPPAAPKEGMNASPDPFKPIQ